jgi:hypothetical protein
MSSFCAHAVWREQGFAKKFQLQCLADDMVDIADGPTNDGIECEVPDRKQGRGFDTEDFRRQQIATLNSRISKLKPKRYHP